MSEFGIGYLCGVRRLFESRLRLVKSTTATPTLYIASMSGKEPTRHQLSSRLQYNANTPAFLQRMQNRVTGGGNNDDEDDEYDYDGSGRPPIPKRPAIPERPEGDIGSGGEDDEDESPQIVVLKEGKHLSEREVENEKRKGTYLSQEGKE